MKNIVRIVCVIFYGSSGPLLNADEYPAEVQKRIVYIQQEVRKDLRAGRVEQAKNTLTQAAGNFHSVEIELSQAQALMQAGEYSHALSAIAHTLAEHPDNSDARILYSWLLAIGGQTQPAIQLLDKNLTSYPHHLALAAKLKENTLGDPSDIPTQDIQLRPFTAEPSLMSPSSRYLTSGVVIADGKRIVTQLSLIANAKKLGIRNGLGQERRARIEQTLADVNLAVLILDKPLTTPHPLQLEVKPPFPGTPIYIIGFASTPNNPQSAWPLLNVDILGMPSPTTGNYDLHVQSTPNGAAVISQQGRLIGIVAAEHNKVLIPLSATFNKPAKTQVTQDKISARLPIDSIYEKFLGNVVQILSLD